MTVGIKGNLFTPILPRHEEARRGAVVYVKLRLRKIGAGEANRTPDPNLGKVMLYP